MFTNLFKSLRIRRLKKEYCQLYGMTRMEAEKSLNRQMVLLKSKKPGQSEEWYLEKIIYDLTKDRK
jgi:hypothetical protein